MKNADKSLRELCAAFGISRRAVQGYEQAGLAAPSGRTERGYLFYNETAQRRILEIYEYQQFGFQLKEIKSFEAMSKQEQRERLVLQKQKIEQAQEQSAYCLHLLEERIKKLE